MTTETPDDKTLAYAIDLLKRCHVFIEEDLKQSGGCDHSVGICVCEEILLESEIERFLDPKKRQTLDIPAFLRRHIY